MMEQVRICAVWPTENWHGTSLNQIQGWTTVRESYSRALEQGPLLFALLSSPPLVLLHHLHAHLDDVHVRLVVVVAATAPRSSSFFKGLEDQDQSILARFLGKTSVKISYMDPK